MATGYTPASPEHTPVVSRKEKSQQPDDPDTEDILTSVRTTKILVFWILLVFCMLNVFSKMILILGHRNVLLGCRTILFERLYSKTKVTRLEMC